MKSYRISHTPANILLKHSLKETIYLLSGRNYQERLPVLLLKIHMLSGAFCCVNLPLKYNSKESTVLFAAAFEVCFSYIKKEKQ